MLCYLFEFDNFFLSDLEKICYISLKNLKIAAKLKHLQH